MRSSSVVWARASLVLLFLGTLLGQVLVPLYADAFASGDAQLEPVQVPYALAGIATLVCAQVVIVAAWQVVTTIDRGTFLDGAALRWLDIARVGIALGAAIPVAVAAHALFVVGFGGLPVFIAMTAALVLGLALSLLLTLARRAYRDASAEHAELASVI